jgi:N-acetylneuraminic acid mutarotase
MSIFRKRATVCVSRERAVIRLFIGQGLMIMTCSLPACIRAGVSPIVRPGYQAAGDIVTVGDANAKKECVILPDARSELAAVSTGSIIVACGGRDKDGFPAADTFIISANGEIKTGKPLPRPRFRHAMARTNEGKVMVAGGVTLQLDGTLGLAIDVLAYDPKSDNWEHVTELPKGSSQCVVEFIDGKLFVIAGDTGTTTEPGYPLAPARCRGDVQIYDLVSHKWSEGAKKPTPETGVTSAVRGDEIFVMSSYDDHGKVSALVEVYDVKQDRWRRIPDMPTARTGVACGFIRDKLYCVNGLGGGLRALSLIEIYDPHTNKWSATKESVGASYASGYAKCDGTLKLIGGRK